MVFFDGEVSVVELDVVAIVGGLCNEFTSLIGTDAVIDTSAVAIWSLMFILIRLVVHWSIISKKKTKDKIIIKNNFVPLDILCVLNIALLR